MRRKPLPSWPGWLLLLLSGPLARAQQAPDTIRLPAAVITAARTAELAPGWKLLQLDSADLAPYRHKPLSDLLAEETSIFVKSYGQGSLATTSFRGSGAGHTAILWNGFNLGSPMNGQMDLSLVPVGVADRVTVQYGSSTALWGGGAVGGAVLLENGPRFGQGLQAEAGASFGSYGDQRQSAGFSMGTGRSSTRIDLFHQAAHNDLEYQMAVPGGTETRRLNNADRSQYGLLAGQQFRIGSDQQAGLHLWYQNSERGIPPTLSQSSSSARQEDQSLRLSGEWQRTGQRLAYQGRAGLFQDQLLWYQATPGPGEESRSLSVVTEAEMKYGPWPGHTVQGGVNLTHTEAQATAYGRTPRQDRAALFASWSYRDRNRHSISSLSLRQEWMDGSGVPFTFSVGSSYQLKPWLMVKANGSRLYRVPTFNDLYWVPGGNPDLRPEHGWSGDLGLAASWRPVGGHTAWNGELTGFDRRVENWIIWLPGPAWWSPSNIMEVWSRGVETNGGVQLQLRRTRLEWKVGTSYVLSTNQAAKGAHDASVGKQLIHVPLYSGHAKAGLTRGPFSASMAFRYTGSRYTSTDNLYYLPAFVLADATMSYGLHCGKGGKLQLMLQALNLFNERYQVLADRPMPLRNWQFGAHFTFGKPWAKAPTGPSDQPLDPDT
jgi:vitamin B12 transporter